MLNQNEQNIINQAKAILNNELNTNQVFNNPDLVKDFCQMQLAQSECEIFGVLFMNNRHQLIQFSEMFRGTIDGASVYPREVAKQALLVNAAAVIITHNHPSGSLEPSNADEQITNRLFDALGLFDIRLLDHIIVSSSGTTSFAERGLL